MRTIGWLIVAVALFSSELFAKGGGIGCGTAEECKVQFEKKKAQEVATFKSRRAEELQEDQEIKRSSAAGREQVKIFRLTQNHPSYGDPSDPTSPLGLGYRDPYFEAQKRMNSWLRQNNVKITRVSQSGELMLVFYR